eukprot:4927733-Amphidinium_carterae.1
MTGWYARKDIDHQYQIKGERLGRQSNWGKTITVGKHMELKVVYKQQNRKIIEDKIKYKQSHFHDYSIITTNRNLDDTYAVKITIEIFRQALAFSLVRDLPSLLWTLWQSGLATCP